MHFVVCAKSRYAELTAGNKYRIYGHSKRGIILRNDSGLLVAYQREYFI